MSQNYLIKTVFEDLEYLKNSIDDKVNDSVLRRNTSILRRLLIENDIYKAIKIIGYTDKIYIVAPRVEFFLETNESDKIDFILAGGGLYQNLFAALAMHNKGKKAIELPTHINPIEYKFSIKEFINSISIYVENTSISRGELIKYVANKMGGVHLDFTRKGDLATKFQVLDSNIDRFFFKGIPPLKGKNTIYFELLSISQLLSNSYGIELFLREAQKFIRS